MARKNRAVELIELYIEERNQVLVSLKKNKNKIEEDIRLVEHEIRNYEELLTQINKKRG